MKLRCLDAKVIDSLVDQSALIEWMREAMIAVSEDQAILPLRRGMAVSESVGAIGMMPGYLASERSAGVKLVSLVPPEARKGSSHLGLMVLYDEEGLMPIALLDGAHITAIRTAAASAAATNELARQGASSLAILGAGEQAKSHILAINEIRDLQLIRVWNRPSGRDNLLRLVEECRAMGLPVEPAETVREATLGSDIVCTTTSAPEPILFGDDVSEGAHVNLVGSSHAGAREVSSDLLVKSKIFIDFEASARDQAGELLKAIEDGDLAWSDVRGEIGEVMSGGLKGRSDETEITLYKSLGIAAQDIITARRIFERANKTATGKVVEL